MSIAENAFQKLYKYMFNTIADPRVEKWTFMKDPTIVIYMSILYLFLVYKYLPFIMSCRKPFNISFLVRIYNIIQIVACTYLVHGMLMAGWLTTYNYTCQRGDFSNDEMSIKMISLMWLTLVVKFLELLETVFFILRKKYNQVTILHVYHHVSTLFIAWIVTKYCGGGMSSFAMLLNSFIHIIMYSYYLLSTMGPKIQKRLSWFKAKITMIQMLQFSIMIVHTSQALRSQCEESKIIASIFLIDVCIVFGFFINFYTKSYMKQTTKVC